MANISLSELNLKSIEISNEEEWLEYVDILHNDTYLPLFEIRGANGSGKTTSVFMVLDWLLEREVPIVLKETLKGKEKTVGLLFPDHRLVILGDYLSGIKTCGCDSTFKTVKSLRETIEFVSRFDVMVLFESVMNSSAFAPAYELYLKLPKPAVILILKKEFEELKRNVFKRGATVASKSKNFEKNLWGKYRTIETQIPKWEKVEKQHKGKFYLFVVKRSEDVYSILVDYFSLVFSSYKMKEVKK